MDASRRISRMVIDPKVRQVGFVTPGTGEASNTSPLAAAADIAAAAAAAAAAATSAAAVSSVAEGTNSPSPVMIPPLRHSSSLPVPVPVPAPIPVPVSGAAALPLQLPSSPTSTMVAGSYVASESLLANSPADTACGYHSIASQDMSDDISPSPFPLVNRQIGTANNLVNSNSSANVAMNHPASSLPSDFCIPQVSSSSPSAMPPSGSMLPPAKAGDQKTKRLKERTSKAERRALQESQRAAKVAAKAAQAGNTNAESGAGVSSKDLKTSKSALPNKDSNTDKKSERTLEKEKKKDVPSLRMQFDDKHRVAKAKRRALVEQTETKHRVELFRHLPQFVHGTQLPALEAKFFQDDSMHPHPSVYKVGLQFLNGDIVGGNARCLAMLSAFRDAINDYKTPPEKVFVRDLTAKFNSYISFLITCRPLSISMGNAIKFLKARIAKIAVNLSETEAKSSVILDIDKFIHEKIILADKVIVNHVVSKIRDGDVLLTYGFSCVVETILLHAHEIGRKFRVVVVDSRPKFEGLAMLRKLLEGGLNCTYTHINGLSFVMKEVTKVLLGAASVLSNGTVYSRVGTACVAMVAHASGIPVLACCEAYKFHERVQLDSICFNELGDPDVLMKVPGRPNINGLEGWTDNEHLQLLNLMYDATPADYVSMIVTDYGMVPPTSVPVIVREYRREYLLV